MSDQNVDVSFSPPDQWTFTPRTVRMTTPGKIVLHRAPSDAPWKFVSAEIVDGDDQFTVTVNAAGTAITITDAVRPPRATFVYRVTVSLDGKEYTNTVQSPGTEPPPSPGFGLMGDPPPEVKNDPN